VLAVGWRVVMRVSSPQFLDRLTPAEWVTDQIRKKRERQRARMQSKFAAKVAAWEAEVAAAEDAAARREEEEKRKALKEPRVVRDACDLVASCVCVCVYPVSCGRFGVCVLCLCVCVARAAQEERGACH
jgi:hypothetical protein